MMIRIPDSWTKEQRQHLRHILQGGGGFKSSRDKRKNLEFALNNVRFDNDVHGIAQKMVQIGQREQLKTYSGPTNTPSYTACESFRGQILYKRDFVAGFFWRDCHARFCMIPLSQQKCTPEMEGEFKNMLEHMLGHTFIFQNIPDKYITCYTNDDVDSQMRPFVSKIAHEQRIIQAHNNSSYRSTTFDNENGDAFRMPRRIDDLYKSRAADMYSEVNDKARPMPLNVEDSRRAAEMQCHVACCLWTNESYDRQIYMRGEVPEQKLVFDDCVTVQTDDIRNWTLAKKNEEEKDLVAFLLKKGDDEFTACVRYKREKDDVWYMVDRMQIKEMNTPNRRHGYHIVKLYYAAYVDVDVDDDDDELVLKSKEKTKEKQKQDENDNDDDVFENELVGAQGSYLVPLMGEELMMNIQVGSTVKGTGIPAGTVVDYVYPRQNTIRLSEQLTSELGVKCEIDGKEYSIDQWKIDDRSVEHIWGH